MLLYPALSVVPQELVFRTFFFHRYGRLFGGPWVATAASALAFSWAHVVLLNGLAVVLTLLGGWLFARTYLRTRSLRRHRGGARRLRMPALHGGPRAVVRHRRLTETSHAPPRVPSPRAREASTSRGEPSDGPGQRTSPHCPARDERSNDAVSTPAGRLLYLALADARGHLMRAHLLSRALGEAGPRRGHRHHLARGSPVPRLDGPALAAALGALPRRVRRPARHVARAGPTPASSTTSCFPGGRWRISGGWRCSPGRTTWW